jgi:hypothetical protein
MQEERRDGSAEIKTREHLMMFDVENVVNILV